MKKNQKIVVANWKMNPVGLDEAKKLFLGIKKISSKMTGVRIVLCPPMLYLSDIVRLLGNSNIHIGSQDVGQKEKGSFTGMVSAKMLSGVGVDFSIVGHSEMRALGETDVQVSEKICSAVKTKMNVVLCIGELERDKEFGYFEFVKNQIVGSLDGVGKNYLKNIYIAYEPVWAISGKSGNKSVLPEQIQEMVLFIKKTLADKYGVGFKVAGFLYGGSVNPKNTQEILEQGGVDGLLVGKASLSEKNFGEILRIVDGL